MKFNAFVPAVAAPLLLRALLKPCLRKHLGAVALVPFLGFLVALPAAAQSSFFGSGEAGVKAQAFGVYLALPTVTTVRSGALGVGTVESRNYAFLDGAAGSMNSLAETTSLAGVGGLHLSARARVEIINAPTVAVGRANALALGSFNDRFFLSVPGYAAGTLFTVTAGVRVDAVNTLASEFSMSSGYSFEAIANWQSVVTIFSGRGGDTLVSQIDRQNCVRDLLGSRCVGSGGGLRSFSFQMPNQTRAAQIYIGGEARTSSRTILDSGGSAIVNAFSDLGHTIAWNGISGVVDPTGAAVSNFSALSATTGNDYRSAYVSPVPEPTPALLLLAGLAAVGWLKRQRAGNAARSAVATSSHEPKESTS